MGKVLLFLLLLISPGLAHKASKDHKAHKTSKTHKASKDHKASKEAQTLQKQREAFLVERKQLLEKIADLEKKRHEFSCIIEEKKQQLSSHQEKIATQLPLLLRLGRINPLRLLVDSNTTQNAVRGVILMRALTTSLNHQIRLAAADLNELRSINEDLNSQNQDYLSLLQKLEGQRDQMKAMGIQVIEDRKKEEEQRLMEENDVSALLEESQMVLSQKEKKKQTSPKAKELPFDQLEHPVVGKIIHDAALQKKFSPQSQGIIFKTQKNASVLAPAKGVIVFRGPFLSQREILIINHGNHVHTVLMGMDKIRAEVGQSVYAGEKIGSMAGYGKTAPLLYIELRQKGRTIDPKPYLVE